MKLLRCNGRVLKIREVGEVVCRCAGPDASNAHILLIRNFRISGGLRLIGNPSDRLVAKPDFISD